MQTWWLCACNRDFLLASDMGGFLKPSITKQLMKFSNLSLQPKNMASNDDNEKITVDNPVTSPDETSKLLNEPFSNNLNGPTSQANSSTSTTKPMLIRQDRTYLASPQLSVTGTNLGESEESTDDFRTDENVRSAPDMLQDLHTPKISISQDAYNDENAQILSPLPATRCRTCRSFTLSSPTSIVYFDRSTSKDSIVHGHLRPHLFVHHHSTTIPPVLVTGSPSRSSRIIRQSSQPEPSSLCGSHCSHAHQSTSLRQLKDPSDALSGIAADALRVSDGCAFIVSQYWNKNYLQMTGGMKSFKQVKKAHFLTFCRTFSENQNSENPWFNRNLSLKFWA